MACIHENNDLAGDRRHRILDIREENARRFEAGLVKIGRYEVILPRTVVPVGRHEDHRDIVLGRGTLEPLQSVNHVGAGRLGIREDLHRYVPVQFAFLHVHRPCKIVCILRREPQVVLRMPRVLADPDGEDIEFRLYCKGAGHRLLSGRSRDPDRSRLACRVLRHRDNTYRVLRPVYRHIDSPRNRALALRCPGRCPLENDIARLRYRASVNEDLDARHRLA